jgi:hypothetical protein
MVEGILKSLRVHARTTAKRKMPRHCSRDMRLVERTQIEDIRLEAANVYASETTFEGSVSETGMCRMM